MTAIFTLTNIKSKKCSTLFRCLTNCAATNNGGIGKSVSLLLYNESNQQMHSERNWCCHVAREECIYFAGKFTAVGFDLWKLNKKKPFDFNRLVHFSIPRIIPSQKMLHRRHWRIIFFLSEQRRCKRLH